jgi:IS5 family transposase
LQLFCGLELRQNQRIRDKDLAGRWRRYLSKYLDIDKWQLQLAAAWKADMQHPHMGLVDATCYESFITYPTDAKLIWKCCSQAFSILTQLRKQAKLRRSRANHLKHKTAYLGFARLRKKSRRKNKKLCRSLLKYLDRLLSQIFTLSQQHPAVRLKNRQYNLIETIQKVSRQQRSHYFGKQARVAERIVSLHKPYIRAIVRGKETKPVEFGAKVNKLVVDGISFIEHISFDAFHEGNRLKSSIALHKRYFGKCFQMGADGIYATNENRSYCTQNHIATCFVPKGRLTGKHSQKSQMRVVLGSIRATVLEGSFGTEKLHYLLDRIKARLQSTEVAWIFFGLLASNAVSIAKRRFGSKARSKAA